MKALGDYVPINDILNSIERDLKISSLTATKAERLKLIKVARWHFEHWVNYLNKTEKELKASK